MNCNEVSQSLLSYLDNEVNPQERNSIEAHLSACPNCRKEMEALAETQRELRQALESMTAGVSPSPHAWATIKQRLVAKEHQGVSILSGGKVKMKEGLRALKSPRPVWNKALAGALSVAMVLGLCLTILLMTDPSSSPPAVASELTKFSSYSELKAFLRENPEAYRYDSMESWGNVVFGAAEEKDSSAPSANDYSTTNIQVEGVDEADIVKTDGDFIYLVSGNEVIIAEAYDPVHEAEVLAEIKLDERIDGIFVNGDKLVVIHENWNDWVVRYEGSEKEYMPDTVELTVPQTYIKVYDISERSNPVLVRNMSIDGNYFGSRMVGDYVYAIISASAYEQDGEVELPVIHPDSTNDSTDVKVDANDIYYIDTADYYYNFTTIASVNVKEDDQEPEYETILMGANSNLYVSLNNIFITSILWGVNSEKTAIHRIRTSGGDIAYEANGEVPGRVLNQFSMDEYQGFFRIATTTTANHVYILNMNLDIVGSLEDLAPGEQIYSARFIGDKGYIVTFKQVDPLFVIDLTNPLDPKELGYLKITGYSDYLHPYGENYLLGIGKEAVPVEEEDFSWYQGVKISIFDVTSFTDPIETAKEIIGDRGTESPVLQDHKALLFDKEKNLLVIPIWLAEIDEAKYPYGDIPPNAYGDIVWQGAYVFHISPEDGIELKGRITHYDDLSQVEGYYYGDNSVQRSLYIGNVLYTISEAKIKMNDLDTLNELGEIQLP
ncbi:beta-propeller domain-containing protein [Chloroflexota bacterium]